jgi:DNA polymerase-3 subunit beta
MTKRARAAHAAQEEQSAPLPFTASVDRRSLLTAVLKAGRVAERRSTVPILSYVAIEAVGSDKLSVRSTNLDTEIEISVEARNASGAVALPARTLRDLLVALRDDDIHLGTDEKGRVSIAAGRSKAALMPLPAADMPRLNLGASSATFTLAEGMLAWLMGVRGAASKDAVRYYLHGVCVDVRDGKLTAVATDGHRLHRRSTEAPAGCSIVATDIIPSTAIDALLAIVRRAEADVEFFLPSGKSDGAPGYARFRIEGATIGTKLIDGTYPDWRRVVPGEFASTFTVRCDHLLGAVAEGLALANKESAGLKLTLTTDKVTLRRDARDIGGEIETVVDGVFAGNALEIGFNGRYLADCIAFLSAAQDAEITLSLNNHGSPCKIQVNDAVADEFAVLMPMRVG